MNAPAVGRPERETPPPKASATLEAIAVQLEAGVSPAAVARVARELAELLGKRGL